MAVLPPSSPGAAKRSEAILISGATGFIGRRLGLALVEAGHDCRALVRSATGDARHPVADLSDRLALTAACGGVDRVFHCAGYAHAFASLTGDDAAMHWQVNFEGPRNLAEAAGQSGVKRFVFLSSVKAMAESDGSCADEDFPGQPETAYGQAKRAAEEAVLDAGRRYGMHVVNLRLAMVYGAGGRGNLERMGRLIRRGLFPPLPETGNHRSLVHVDDVLAAIQLAADDDRGAGRTYIVAALEAPSGRQLYDALREALDMSAGSWAMPEQLLRIGARVGDALEMLMRRRFPLDSEVLDRLLGSAWYSPKRIERELGWQAQVTLKEGLREMFGK
ncbi:MAG: NAD-dependent epimerase/dehydratase family protein [Dechloromonas sp.]|nr:NAD-dependent epimerase/dehydratase family protein [Dechloromonas sp.]